MKKWNKILSVGLSLVMCAGMVTPAFAAVALDREQHIDSKTGALKQNSEGNYNYYLEKDVELEQTLVIGNGVEALIDLMGKNLVHTGATGAVISISDGGKLTLDDSTAATDEDGNYTAGHVTGGKGTGDYVGTGRNWWDVKAMGGGVHVANGGTFVLDNGIITGNTAAWGGGIGNNGTVIMKNGIITGNTAQWGGGVFSGNLFTMKNGSISNNTSTGDGGGIYNSGKFTMDKGKINGNISGFDGGAMYMCIWWNTNNPSDGASFTMNGGEVADNQAISATQWAGGGGIAGEGGTTFTMNGGALVRNTAQGNTADNTGPNGVEGDMTVNIDYDNVIAICNYGVDGVVNTMHQVGAYKDLGASGHEATCIHDCGATFTEPHNFGGWFTVIEATANTEGLEARVCSDCGHAETRSISVPDRNGHEDTGSAAIGIDDEAVPLAGLFTRADAVGYLWEQAGSPEWELSDFADVPEDHEWAVAIGWGQAMGIAVADEDGNFRPDELVLRSTDNIDGEFQEFLNRYADKGELFIELEGEPDDVIMGEEAQVIFDDFFAKLEAADIAA